jgi:hypothetical protein
MPLSWLIGLCSRSTGFGLQSRAQVVDAHKNVLPPDAPVKRRDADDLIETLQCGLNAKIGPGHIPVHGTA